MDQFFKCGACKNECEHKSKVFEAQSSIPIDDDLYYLSELFKVFGDFTRVKILYTLIKNELCVFDIAEAVEMSQSAVSHQLRVLKQSRLVKYRREGKTVYYSLCDDHIITILGVGLEHITE